MKYQVRIVETLLRIVEVEANDSSEAVDKVQDMIDDEEIVLDWNDFDAREIDVL